jgi:hypothetical protein
MNFTLILFFLLILTADNQRTISDLLNFSYNLNLMLWEPMER